MVVWLVGRFANRPYVRRVGSLDRNGCCGGEGAWWFGWQGGSRTAPTSGGLDRWTGMGVAVAKGRGGLVGRAGLKPAPTPGGLHRWRGLGVAVVEGRGVWLVGHV